MPDTPYYRMPDLLSNHHLTVALCSAHSSASAARKRLKMQCKRRAQSFKATAALQPLAMLCGKLYFALRECHNVMVTGEASRNNCASRGDKGETDSSESPQAIPIQSSTTTAERGAPSSPPQSCLSATQLSHHSCKAYCAEVKAAACRP